MCFWFWTMSPPRTPCVPIIWTTILHAPCPLIGIPSMTLSNTSTYYPHWHSKQTTPDAPLIFHAVPLTCTPCNGPSSLCIASLAEDSCTSPDISTKMHHLQFEPFRTNIADWPRSQTFIANLGEASGGISDQIAKSDLKAQNTEIRSRHEASNTLCGNASYF